MADLDLWMIGHTTDDIRSLYYPNAFIEGLKKLFGNKDLKVQWLDNKSERLNKKEYSIMTTGEITAVYSKGAIALSDNDEKVFDAGIEWNRVRGREKEDFISSQGYSQNKILLKINSFMVKDDKFNERYIIFCSAMAKLFNVNYLYSYHYLHSNAMFCTKFGLLTGLKDIYWINIFGIPYIKIIGSHKLLTCPAFSVRQIDENHIIVQTTKNFIDPNSPSMEAVRNHIKNHLGLEFFVKNNILKQEKEGGIINIFQFMRFLYKSKKEFEDTSNDAIIHPTFDWSNIFFDD